MRVLVLGSGGREHALAWKLAQSPLCDALICAPGNPGMAGLGECVALDITNTGAVVAFATQRAVDLVVVGPEDPLCNGVVDALEEHDITAFGPRATAARLEGSKAFAKEIMHQAGVRTADARTFTDPDAAWQYAQETGAPLVIKADGLAAGKGVTVCDTLEQAQGAIDATMRDRAFGDSGAMVLVEQFLDGEECSIFGLCDGTHVLPLATSQDHKRIGEGDTGPNTGGMGAYSPAPVVDDAMLADIHQTILQPVVNAMSANGTPFAGVLYAGLMICDGVPYVIEFNCRFGDPECQVHKPRMAGDLLPLMLAATAGSLAEQTVAWRDDSCACVVLASGGYPGSYEKGKRIVGIDAASGHEGVTVFQAGTALDGGGVVTNGGRVLNVTALGPDLHTALDRAYAAAEQIHFDGKYARRDIGHRALARLTTT